MQRVISLQTSRNADRDSTEFVTKRLCCSFLFSVAFLSLLGGFLLGRYATDRAIILKTASLQVKQQDEEKHSMEIMRNLSKLVDSINDLITETHVPNVSTYYNILRCSNNTLLDITAFESDLRTNTPLKTSRILSMHLAQLNVCFSSIQSYLQGLIKPIETKVETDTENSLTIDDH